MIFFNVAQLLKENTGATRDVTFSDRPASFNPDVALVEPVAGAAHMLRTNRGILVQARYDTRVRLECGRCLEPAESVVHGEVADEFMPSVNVFTGATLPEQAESSELRISHNHELDLTEVLRQDILTRLPLQPLCDEACEGLCEQCGTPRAQGPCGCSAPGGNPALAGLAELLREQPDKPPTL